MPIRPSPITAKYTGHGVVASSMWLRGTQVTIRNRITKMPSKPPISSIVAPTFGFHLRSAMPIRVGTISTTSTCATLPAGTVYSAGRPFSCE
jgi:hypothetical protein